jgi:hypothetical protein
VKKKTILLLCIISVVIALIGTAMFVPSIIAAANHCTTNAFGGRDCSLPVSDPLTFVGLAGVLVLILGGLSGTIAWIGALIRAAKMQTWGWFVVVLLLHALGTLIYAIAGPPEQPALAPMGMPSPPRT